jgi:hypothetical protein
MESLNESVATINSANIRVLQEQLLQVSGAKM